MFEARPRRPATVRVNHRERTSMRRARARWLDHVEAPCMGAKKKSDDWALKATDAQGLSRSGAAAIVFHARELGDFPFVERRTAREVKFGVPLPVPKGQRRGGALQQSRDPGRVNKDSKLKDAAWELHIPHPGRSPRSSTHRARRAPAGLPIRKEPRLRHGARQGAALSVR